MIATFNKVFGNWRYVLLSIGIALAVFLGIIWFQNYKLLWQTMSTLGIGTALEIAFLSLGSIASNNTILSAVGLIVTALLFGVNVSLFIYYMKRKIQNVPKRKTGISGTLGFIFGVIGVGCASCGTVLLSALLSVVGLGGVLTMLPLDGQEFIFVGVVLLVFSTYELLKKIKDPMVCQA